MKYLKLAFYFSVGGLLVLFVGLPARLLSAGIQRLPDRFQKLNNLVLKGRDWVGHNLFQPCMDKTDELLK